MFCGALMSFFETVEQIRSQSAQTNEHQQSARLFQLLETAYLTEVNRLIKQLNVAQSEQIQQILRMLREADRLYLNARGMEITGHILFSRHGQCSIWDQKKLGVSPNTAISEEAERNMAKTNRSSGALLCYAPQEHPPLIAVSPMNRAMQTAGLATPLEIKNADIRVLSFLAENSIAPSGYDVRSVADMQELYNQLSFWTSPIRKLLLKLAIWTYSDRDFDLLYEKRKSAAEKIQEHGNKILSNGDKPDVCQDLKYHGDKIKDIRALIDTVDQRDCWLFGHGKNFWAFFQDVFGMESAFDYAETRRVYKTNTQGNSSLYTPPYVLVINQKTGVIEGKYTGEPRIPRQEKSSHVEHVSPSGEESSPDVSRAMTQLGNPVVQQQEGSSKKSTLKPSVHFVKQPHIETEHYVHSVTP